MSQSNQRAGRRPGRGRRGGPGGRGGRSKSTSPSTPVAPLHPTENPPNIESFSEFSLHETVQQAIADMGIVKPTPIQALTTEPVLNGKDVIAKAETGTGKTLAFGAPMISKIDAGRSSVLGLVLTPTRELAEQVATVLEQLGKARDIKVALIVGGEPAGPQVAALQKGAQVVVGTPGRVIDLYEQKFLGFPWTEFVVLDEADEMLEIGFIDDVKKILQFTPDERQTLLFSATFPDALLRLARDYTTDPAEISTASGVKTVDNIEQEYIELGEDERPLALIRMIERSSEDDVFLIFCERRTDVERLMRRLERLSFSTKALHGGYDQSARFRVMSAFRTGEVKALVATDVASRGLDVKHVTRVVNFSPPRSITAYTHRIGRTGRAGRQGHAVTFVSPPNRVRWNSLLRDASWEIHPVDAPGSRYSRGRTEAPVRAPRDEESQREERPRRSRQDREDEPRQARPEREERPRRSRRDREETEDGPRRRDPEEVRERPRRSRRDEEPRERSRTESRSPRPASRPAFEDGPVELPANRTVRQRDPNDPPRRVRRKTETREDIPEREERPRRSRSTRDEREERPRRSRRDSEERPRSCRDDDDRPRRSRRDTEDSPRRSHQSESDRPRRSERSEAPRRSRHVEEERPFGEEESRPARLRPDEIDRPRRARREREDRPSRSDREESRSDRESEGRPTRRRREEPVRRDEIEDPRRARRSEEDRPRRSRRSSEDRPSRSRDEDRPRREREPRERERSRDEEPRRRSAPRRDSSERSESSERAPERERPARPSNGGGGFGTGL